MFHCDDLNIEIINIFLINRSKSEYNTPKRPFHILTKRIEGYSEMFFGKEHFKLNTDQLFYIPANIEYSRKSYENEIIIAVHFNIINRSFEKPELISVDSDEVDEILYEMYNTWSSRKTGYRYQCTSMLYKLMNDIMIPHEHTNTYKVLEKSIDYINENLSSKITIKQLADISCISENYYRRIFKKEFGTSPIEYINNKRILKAKEMLISGYFSIAQTAFACGFSEPKYFNAVFKKITGTSPTQFRHSFSTM